MGVESVFVGSEAGPQIATEQLPQVIHPRDAAAIRIAFNIPR